MRPEITESTHTLLRCSGCIKPLLKPSCMRRTRARNQSTEAHEQLQWQALTSSFPCDEVCLYLLWAEDNRMKLCASRYLADCVTHTHPTSAQLFDVVTYRIDLPRQTHNVHASHSAPAQKTLLTPHNTACTMNPPGGHACCRTISSFYTSCLKQQRCDCSRRVSSRSRQDTRFPLCTCHVPATAWRVKVTLIREKTDDGNSASLYRYSEVCSSTPRLCLERAQIYLFRSLLNIDSPLQFHRAL